MDFTFSWKIVKYWINRKSINNLILDSLLSSIYSKKSIINVIIIFINE